MPIQFDGPVSYTSSARLFASHVLQRLKSDFWTTAAMVSRMVLLPSHEERFSSLGHWGCGHFSLPLPFFNDFWRTSIALSFMLYFQRILTSFVDRWLLQQPIQITFYRFLAWFCQLNACYWPSPVCHCNPWWLQHCVVSPLRLYLIASSTITISNSCDFLFESPSHPIPCKTEIRHDGCDDRIFPSKPLLERCVMYMILSPSVTISPFSSTA